MRRTLSADILGEGQRIEGRWWREDTLLSDLDSLSDGTVRLLRRELALVVVHSRLMDDDRRAFASPDQAVSRHGVRGEATTRLVWIVTKLIAHSRDTPAVIVLDDASVAASTV